MLDFLKSRYGTVGKLNSAWQTGFDSWDDVMENTVVPASGNDDLKAFTAILAHKYFREVKQTLEKAAPRKLYLGCRFNSHYYPDEDTSHNWVIQIAAKYCDVVSFNRYRYSAIDLKPADADVPVIIGEFHMGALDRGMLHYTLRFAENQEHRAELFEYYLQSCLKNPFIVGAHWYEYADEPTLGRFDGENFNTGFVDICDRPYPEMVKASRRVGGSMYDVRY